MLAPCREYARIISICPTMVQGTEKGGQSMSTKELQRLLRGIGKSDKEARQYLVRRYDREVPQEEKHGERDCG